MRRIDFLKALGGFLLGPIPISDLIAQENRLKNQVPLKAKIPSSGEELLRVGLGTYQAFDVRSDSARLEELKQVLTQFIQLGGTLIDSSPMYGLSESVVGDLSDRLSINRKLFMATKVWTTGRESGLTQMGESFAKLRREKLELMQIHNLVDWTTHIKVLRKWKEEGRIRYIGITHYSTGAYAQMEKILRSEQMDFIQIPYSLAETTGEKSLIPLASEKGVAVIANEPFAQGALFRRVQNKPVPAWVQEIGILTWAQYFLKFILSDARVQFAIPATSRLSHLNDNMQASSGELPSQKQREQMRKEFAAI